MDLLKLIENLKNEKKYQDQIVHLETTPKQSGRFGEPNKPLPKLLEERLHNQDIDKFYIHQAESINLVREGKDVIIVTGTASGKSLCYNVPVLESIIESPKNRALYLFPTKALAQDQLRVLNEFGLSNLKGAAYDGDTPRDARSWIRKNANLVLSNPDMLNIGILPYHKRWADFFLNLKYVVIDEVHTLRGIFGSNVSNVIRRLRRICDYYNSSPQFVLSSATVANPKVLADKLTGLDVQVVDDDGSPQGKKLFLFWNPPFVNQAKSERRSSNSETTQLFTTLAKSGVRNITFSKSRKAAELIYSYGLQGVEDTPKLKKRLASYRAGYLPRERRAIEKKLFNGELVGVSATNALELGIDVGALDGCVINGFPGTISSCWQQAGRAGRRSERSIVFLVASGDPLDQYYMNRPKDFFGKSHEEAIIDFANPKVLSKHLSCAAFEVPLTEADEKYFGEDYFDVLKPLEDEGALKKKKDKWFWAKKENPSEGVNIRSASKDDYSIVEAESGILLGSVDDHAAFFYVHPGAVYLHQGESYQVTDLDLEEKIAFVESARNDYYTQPRDRTDLEVIKETNSRELRATRISFGKVDVTTEVFGYQRKRVYTGEVIGDDELDLPPRTFQTDAYWFLFPDDVVAKIGLDKKELAGGIHAVERGNRASSILRDV